MQKTTRNYIYDASGVKLKKTVSTGKVTEYAGNYIYENDQLQFFSHAEGYVTPSGSGGYDYVYQYKDHLGNVRLSYMDANNNGSVTTAEVIEESNYYPFGLEHKGYNNVVNGVENNYKTYQGKEEEKELGRNTYDFGWRDFDPAIARWTVIDPLAEKYYSQSPFVYVANSPMVLSDPNGKEISFSITRDEDGEITGITINVTGKIINNSSRKLNQKQLERRRDRILKGLSNIKIEGNGVAVNFTGNIGIANSESDISKTDHVYRLVDDISKVPGANHTNPNTNPEGFAPLGQNVIYLENDFTSRTAAHETGHSASLKHIDDSSLRDFEPYAVDYFRGVARSPQHAAAEQVSAENYVYKIYNTRYSADDFPKNLMHQSATRNSKGNPVAGNKVTRGQVTSIIYKIENGQINKGKQK
ncbi:hypothetical protein OOZ15_19510 [Galbibacter sp. EGI 63066]|uniref:RHS repeat domain-containing protein n=1 Tax=Galbibacter sp. EGI 63066 TaxID=2993559 RepID=UPI0022499DB0|nr:RHS repeat-associated core domain-containing protein [Galbibacter sp. EGI 63066]MCX2682143.1 hypothetical protein [Galbibacter sp. EGI 63066]